MNILDLRQTSVRQLEPLLEEKHAIGMTNCNWDYRGALDLIKRFSKLTRLRLCSL